MPFIVWVVVAVITVAAVFWEQLREWASTTLTNAIGRILGESFRTLFLEAVVAVDTVTTRIRRAAEQAWEVLKLALLDAAVTIERRSRSQFVQRLCGYIRRSLEGEKTKVYRVVHEEEVDFDDLPDDVRAQFIKGEEAVDATEVLSLKLQNDHT